MYTTLSPVFNELGAQLPLVDALLEGPAAYAEACDASANEVGGSECANSASGAEDFRRALDVFRNGVRERGYESVGEIEDESFPARLSSSVYASGRQALRSAVYKAGGRWIFDPRSANPDLVEGCVGRAKDVHQERRVIGSIAQMATMSRMGAREPVSAVDAAAERQILESFGIDPQQDEMRIRRALLEIGSSRRRSAEEQKAALILWHQFMDRMCHSGSEIEWLGVNSGMVGSLLTFMDEEDAEFSETKRSILCSLIARLHLPHPGFQYLEFLDDALRGTGITGPSEEEAGILMVCDKIDAMCGCVRKRADVIAPRRGMRSFSEEEQIRLIQMYGGILACHARERRGPYDPHCKLLEDIPPTHNAEEERRLQERLRYDEIHWADPYVVAGALAMLDTAADTRLAPSARLLAFRYGLFGVEEFVPPGAQIVYDWLGWQMETERDPNVAVGLADAYLSIWENAEARPLSDQQAKIARLLASRTRDLS